MSYSPFGGIESTVNSTTTVLGISETFTGTAEQNFYPDVMVSCYADVAGTLYFDFSINGTDWRTFPSSGFAVAAGIHEFHTAVKGPRYFRCRFVNGASAQSTFQLQTYYGAFKQPSAPRNQAIGLDSDAISVRPTIPGDEAVLGLLSGVTAYNKFCYRDNSTASAGEETVWSDTTNFTVMTTAGTFDIAYDGTSGGSTDGANTVGARQLLIDYLDSNFQIQQAVHVLGTDGSDTTSFSGLGINRVVVFSSGSNNANSAAITITATSGGTTQAHIPAGSGVTQMSVFHVPISTTAIIKKINLNVNKVGGTAPIVTFRMRVYNRFVESSYELIKMTIDTGVENTVTLEEPVGLALSGRDVVYWTMDTNTNSTVASVRYAFIMYADA